MFTAFVLVAAIGAQPCDCVYKDKLTINPGPCDCTLCECGPDIPRFAPNRVTNYDTDAAAALAIAKAKLRPKVAPATRPGNLGDGHTHTCANGHTWNHATHAGHDCPVCGLSQYIQDPSPRAVNLSTMRTLPSFQGEGGCANGQCQTGSQRRGLFGRLR